LGTLLYELISGRMPFGAPASADGSPSPGLLRAKLNDEPAPLEYVPLRLAAAIDRALAPLIRERYQNAAQFADVLGEIADSLNEEEANVLLPLDGASPVTAAKGSFIEATTPPLGIRIDGRWVAHEEQELPDSELPNAA